MKKSRKNTFLTDSGEGFIDLLFLLLTFFIVQNVWQIHLTNSHNRFVHAQKLDFIKAVATEQDQHTGKENKQFIKVIVGQDFVQFDKGGIIPHEQYAFQHAENHTNKIEQTVFDATHRTLQDIVLTQTIAPENILVRLYFERNATVSYTVGVYDALHRLGFKKIQWGLENQHN